MNKTTEKQMLKPIDDTQIQKKESVVEEIPKGWLYIDWLPSNFKCYPKGTKILSRPLKVLELKHLATMTEKTSDMVIDNVLKDSVMGIDYEDLLIADKLFIIMWQRANTYQGDEFSIPFTCPECGHDGKYTFNPSKLSFSDVPEDYSPDKVYKIGDHNVQLDQFRIKTKAMVNQFVLEDNTVDIDILTSVAVRIGKLDGNDVDLRTAYDFVVNMDPKDFIKLNDICEKTAIKVFPVVEVKCESCGKEVPVMVSFTSEFFLPSYSDQRSA